MSVWEVRQGNTPGSLADKMLHLEKKNRKLHQRVHLLKDEKLREKEQVAKRVESNSVGCQTTSSFFQDERTSQQNALALQKRLERLVALQDVATRKYDRQLRKHQEALDDKRDMTLVVANLEQKLEQATTKIVDLKKQLRGSKLPQQTRVISINNPADFANWMKERDFHIGKIASLERENELLRAGLKESNKRYDHLKLQVGQLSPAFFKELEDLKFQLHHEKVKSRALQHRIDNLQ
eukprot:m.88541 g.88541  ORF g.88541 m.88541 type:complete len:237 (+) comp8811_c0_seq7:195-905(+)